MWIIYYDKSLFLYLHGVILFYLLQDYYFRNITQLVKTHSFLIKKLGVRTSNLISYIVLKKIRW